MRQQAFCHADVSFLAPRASVHVFDADRPALADDKLADAPAVAGGENCVGVVMPCECSSSQ